MNIDYNKLLKGKYELARLPKNFSAYSIVPDFGYNVLNILSPLYQPIVDEYYIENGGFKPIWPEHKPFAVCLTHDVDHVSLNSLIQDLRFRKQQLSEKITIINLLKSIAGFGAELALQNRKYFTKDPIHCYEKWLEAEEKIKAKSTFFISPGWSNITIHHESDCLYELSDKIIYDKQKCSVLEMIKEIVRRGWEVGLHPSFSSHKNVDELKRQKEGFEKAVGIQILSVRQHYLYYDISKTPSVHAKAGFKYDSTLGFNDNIGFRFGSCYPWYLTDLKCDRILPIMEIPLIIQDGAMLKQYKGLKLDENMAFKYVAYITEKVERVGGVLTLLWHPSSIQNKNSWNLYLKVLDYLKKKDAWFATVKEVGNWWGSIKNKINLI